MGERGECIPPSAPPSEGYWEALLRDGEFGRAGPSASPTGLWEERASALEQTTAETAESGTVEAPWETAHDLMTRGEILDLPVVGCNRGGLIVAWNGLRGFVPASHLVRLAPAADGGERQGELRRLVGTRLSLKIIELEADSERFVLSERATQIGTAERQTSLKDLAPGDVCTGRVTNLCSFGAFIDLGGFEGLAHISELSWGRVGHPSDVLDPGELVEVYVLNVEADRERVGLSLKRLQPNPWQSVEERYGVGQMVDGTVTHVVDFGAFVQVEDGLEGLVHVSELASGQPCNPHDVLRSGDVVSVEILSIDGSRRRMGLRLHQVRRDAATLARGDAGDAEGAAAG